MSGRRVAFLTTMAGVPWGGSELLWAQAAERALERGHEVGIVVFDWSRNVPAVERLARRGAILLARPRHRSPGLLARGARALAGPLRSRRDAEWVRELLRFSPEALCLSQGSLWEILFDEEALELAGRIECPVTHLIQLTHDLIDLAPAARETARRLYLGSAATLFVAEKNLEMARRQLASPLPGARVVRNPVNLGRLERVARDRQGGPAVLACVARLNVRHKGQDILFESLSGSQWGGRPWECRLYGEGEDSTYLEQLAKHYGFEQRIRFMGHVGAVESIWRACDLLVMPSRMEGTPLALVEAMVCGRPAVVTDVGGTTEWIEEPGCGFVAEGVSARSLGAALERAWAARESWGELGEAARARAMRLVDPDPGGTLLEVLLRGAERPGAAGARP